MIVDQKGSICVQIEEVSRHRRLVRRYSFGQDEEPSCQSRPSVANQAKQGDSLSSRRAEQYGVQWMARLIEVEWGASGDAGYPVDISIEAYDRPGLLRDITAKGPRPETTS